MLKEHPAYQEELVKLEATKVEVEKAYEVYNELYAQYKTEVQQNLREFKGNPDEGSQLYIELMTGTMFVQHYAEKIKGLERSLQTPYFARIDFTAAERGELEKCYIGKTGLLREGDNEPVIIDWRAPVATLYYEGRLGEVSYVVPDKLGLEDITITGDLSLKRQFTIEKGVLKDIFDIDVTTTDPLLQKALGANADNRLKDIASTIQAEQNRIIRADMKRPLIVQGVAGSGKTTIALHRIAYLIYTYENVFKPDSFMIIAPNRLFLDYISGVLPELGVENVKQTTYIDFMLEQLGEHVKVTNPNEKLTAFVNQKLDETVTDHHEMLKKVSKYKGSLTFKKTIDKFVNDLEENFIPRQDLKLDEHVLVSAAEIRHIFLNEYKYYPIYKRIHKLIPRLKKSVKALVADLIDKEKKRADNLVDQYYSAGLESEADRQRILRRLEERDHNITHWGQQAKTLVDDYFAGTENRTLMDYYKDIVANPDNLELYTGGLLSDEFMLFLSEHSTKVFASGKIEYEDLAALVYLKSRLFGLEERLRLSHVVIDEAQDFSLFQFYLIKRLSHTDSFTILGDLSQGIHSYRAIENWDEVEKLIFTKTSTTYRTLEQSYRTTIEIMNLANEIIKHHPYEGIIFANPIIRHGEKPCFAPQRTPDELIDFILEETYALQDREEVNSIAIIGKTMEECQKIYDLFPAHIKPKLITEDMSEYESGLIILPSYLAKGLEFDVVFIVNLDETYAKEELDVKLLYIAMTRALHRLYLCSTGELSVLVEDVDHELFQMAESV